MENIDEKSWLTKEQILEPKDYKNSIVLLHGYGGSPFDLYPLAQKLYNQGFRVHIPMLPGFAKFWPFRWGLYRYEYYMNWLRELLEKEKAQIDGRLYLGGFSTGGTLSTLIADQLEINKIVLIAPYYCLTRGDRILSFISKIFTWILPFQVKLWKGNINDPDGYKAYKTGTYITSLPAFNCLQRLAKKAQKRIEKIQTKTLIVGSPTDEVACFSTSKNLWKQNKKAKIIEYPRSNHILLFDYDSKEAIQAIQDFLIA